MTLINQDIIIAVIASGLITTIINKIFERRKVNVEITKVINEMAINIAKERQNDIKRLEEKILLGEKRLLSYEEKSALYQEELAECVETNRILAEELSQLKSYKQNTGRGL